MSKTVASLIRKIVIPGLLAWIPFSLLFAQMPASLGSAELFLRLKKLNVLGSVLYVAAHPDDENTRLLAYLAKEKLYRTGYLSMTRGDGGQNLIGDEQGVELGLIRTQELLAARRIDGAEQFFARAFDFGFTKTTEEALRTWDREKILSDVVWVIRKFQPDVIITRFPEDSRAGHGHHSASAVLAHEAYIAAADPKRFPEQFQYGVKPWKAHRLLWNGFNFGGSPETTDGFKMDIGNYNAVLGKSYGEIAAESRSQHKSQGFGVARSRGQWLEYFTTTLGTPPQKDLTDGIETDWSRVEGGKPIGAAIGELIQQYSLSHPEKSVPGLVKLYQQISALPDGYWRNQKCREVQELIEACSGLFLEATVNRPYIAQGDSLRVALNMIDRFPGDVTITHIRINGSEVPFGKSLEYNQNYFLTFPFRVSPDKPVTQPYWLEEDMSPGSFNVKDPRLIGEAQSPPAYSAVFSVRIGGQTFELAHPVQYKFTDPVKGELYEPLTVLPAFTGSVQPQVLLFPSTESRNFEVDVKREDGGGPSPQIVFSNTGTLQVTPGSNYHDTRYLYSARPQNGEQAVVYSGLGFREGSGQEPVKELKTLSYDHIPRIDYFKKAAIRFVVADLKTEGRRIGYIEGAGDKVPQALEQMGYEVVVLKEKDLVPGALKAFDAILTGVRAYNVHEWLSGKYDVLMDYVREGGNLIVQYNTSNQAGVGGGRAKIGPYPFNIGRGRVTDEQAKVNFLLPDHPVLNTPNKITARDFEGWIQERGIYFADQPDPAFETIFSMKDPGESEQAGSLVIAGYGKGKFVYTGLVFFRELPAGVPGAYRLLANIIALNHKK